MRPDHRAQLAAAIARFQVDLRELVRMVHPQERARLLIALDPTRARSASVSTTATRKRGTAAVRKQPARTRRASAGARQASRRGARTPASIDLEVATTAVAEISTEPRMPDPAEMEISTATVARAEPAARAPDDRTRWVRREHARLRRDRRRADRAQRRQTRKERAQQRRAEAAHRATATAAAPTGSTPAAVGTGDRAAGGRAASIPRPGTSSPPLATSTSSTAPAEIRGPARQGGALAAPAAGSGGGKRVRWTREAIIDELAGWMVTGTALDSSFVQRHGPPGLVAAARRVFGRFDAALNVAGLHVAKLYPDSPPRDGPRGGRWSRSSPGPG